MLRRDMSHEQVRAALFKLDQCKVIPMSLYIYNPHMIDNLKSPF